VAVDKGPDDIVSPAMFSPADRTRWRCWCGQGIPRRRWISAALQASILSGVIPEIMKDDGAWRGWMICVIRTAYGRKMGTIRDLIACYRRKHDHSVEKRAEKFTSKWAATDRDDFLQQASPKTRRWHL
jgi:hypothetical protein